MYKPFKSETKIEAFDTAFHLLDKAYRTFQALNQERVLSPGGIITATKTYIKSAVLVLDMIEELRKEDHESIEKLLLAVVSFYDLIKKKEYKLRSSNHKEDVAIAKKLKATAKELRRVEIRLREMLVKTREK